MKTLALVLELPQLFDAESVSNLRVCRESGNLIIAVVSQLV